MRDPRERHAPFAKLLLPVAFLALATACEAPAPQEADAPAPAASAAQPAVDVTQEFADLIAVDADPVALTGVKLLDG
ncbi:MAG: hypothetical protein OXI12_00805, partial [Gammaproteobacteria bacterium]|nr:hypothetical protein [Gammaproteobacteria bacterium]